MADDRLSAAAYERAERLLGHNRSELVLHAGFEPTWFGDGATFWYRTRTEAGTEFIRVDPDMPFRGRLFDHARLARSLTRSAGAEVEPYDLPIAAVDVDAGSIAFDAFGARWACGLSDYVIDQVGAARSPFEVMSPDGRWVAYLRGHDLWIRATDSGETLAVTTDGSAERSYASYPDASVPIQLLRRLGTSNPPPVVLWSPDSSRILTHVTHQRGVTMAHLVDSAPADGGRPWSYGYHYAVPGEKIVPSGEWLIFDIETRTAVLADTTPFPLLYRSPIKFKFAWWDADGSTVYYLDRPRDMRTLSLKSIDAMTGQVRTLITESSNTRVEPVQRLSGKPIVRVLPNGNEALWYSQRDGWGHLYLYDVGSGDQIRQLTSGPFAVQEILHVDDARRVAHLLVAGLVDADPYRRSVVTVDMETGDLARITDDSLDHVAHMPPHGRWFVDSASTVSIPPNITVRKMDGTVMLDVGQADISRLVAAGWTPPERIRTVAADGVTPIYGVLYKPHGFDPATSYPIVDHIYPGPQINRVPPSFDPGDFGPDAEAVAALGFVVIAVDGRGTPGRDKAFHDRSYGDLGSCGALEDHVAALEQLAESRPWMDLDRVGIFGRSGGGFAAARALMAFPDTYKVGISEAGNHDNRLNHAMWAETYHGPVNMNDPEETRRLSNTEMAENLRGRLLLMHGEMDENVTPPLTMRLVDRLIKANKDFDLLLVPTADHDFGGVEFYVIRKRWDYLIRNLLHREPPEYRLAGVVATRESLENNLSKIY